MLVRSRFTNHTLVSFSLCELRTAQESVVPLAGKTNNAGGKMFYPDALSLLNLYLTSQGLYLSYRLKISPAQILPTGVILPVLG